jgi:hypothetical protein
VSPATLIPLVLGAMLGFGVLLIVQGVRVMRDASLDEASRKKGFWRLNIGLVLIAVSMIAFARTGGA